ncbi:hypothetical protein FBU59_001871 [Linderina macrospora]|uniref:Uncharacterized protein n=1 Tax=Linderina macrospora TaxID=4868 RepID=A0ACC1JD31_9FUNG|nr:hypothetical protein FBU59_001871 [Linderina macrospora]
MQQFQEQFLTQNMFLLNPFETPLNTCTLDTAFDAGSFGTALNANALSPNPLNVTSSLRKPSMFKHGYTRSMDSSALMSHTYTESPSSSSSFDSPTTSYEDFGWEDDSCIKVPTEIVHDNPPPGKRMIRVPEGFHPVFIDLRQKPRHILRRALHEKFCVKQPNMPVDAVGRCKCELHEFENQPDFMFGKRPRPEDNEASEESCSDGEDSDVQREALRKEYEENKIKRPPNSFMMYRRSRHHELVKRHRGGNKVISRIVAEEWHALSKAEKKIYEEMAAEKKREHEMLYPNYKFAPKRARK